MHMGLSSHWFWSLAALVPVAPVRGGHDDSLRELASPIRTIEPADDDFEDLLPLIEAIGDARVVVLGEATHSEGTTSAAKARVARFLHAKMGFGVLAWESGFLQTEGMNARLRDPEVPLSVAKSYLIAGGWASEVSVDPLFAYARSSWKTSHPLRMTAFDTGRPHRAVGVFRETLESFFERAPELAWAPEEWAVADRLTRRAFGFMSSEVPDPLESAEERGLLEELLSEIRAEREQLLRTVSPRELNFVTRAVEHALTTDRIKPLRGLEWNTERDRAMADTLVWLLEEAYPGEKIMVWAATSHFIRNATSIENAEDSSLYTVPFQAGNHLEPLLGPDLYTLAFTAYGGTLGDVFPEGSTMQSRVIPMDPAPPGSFEARAHDLSMPYAFVDLRSAPRDHWLRGEFRSVALGRWVNEAPWSSVVDGFFFIDEAEPVAYMPR